MNPDSGHPRRVLFVADSPGGGAGIAALRLFEELKRSGVDIRFLVWREAVSPAVGWNQAALQDLKPGLGRKFRKALGMVKDAKEVFARWRRAGRRDRFFHGKPDSFEITTIFPGQVHLEDHPWFAWADIVHLHWTAGFLAPAQKWSDKLWVISLHDANPLTAVCHFPADCTRFETGCRECPQLVGTKNPRLSKSIYQEKLAGYRRGGRITLHAPSAWIAELASRSPITRQFRAKILPNLFPTEVFRPLEPRSCRELLDLPVGEKLGLFVAGHLGNARKGFPWFLQLARKLSSEGWRFVIVGGGDIPPLPDNCHLLGRLGDLRLMAAAYSAADLFISTTLQDTVPATIIESQLCGTPVIGFDVGGQREMIVEGETGFLSPGISLDGLVEGVNWYQSKQPSRARIAELAMERWNKQRVVRDWFEFYRELK